MSARVEINTGREGAARRPRREAGVPRAFATGACLAIALVFSLEATGGIADDGRRPTAVESMARVPAPGKRPTLRCWQYGRLVYEASDIQLFRDGHGEGIDSTATAAAAATAAGVPAADRAAARVDAKAGERPVAGTDGRRRVRLLDLNQGLCIID